jgi:pimeloyl-ACP methyl ester carboxylesterase
MIRSLSAAVDIIATRAAYWQSARARRRSPSETLGHEQRLARLRELASQYPQDDEYFREPRAIEWQQTSVRTLGDGGRVIDVRWDSDYRTFLPRLAERYHKCEDNRFAAARLFLHRDPRPGLVLVHGYMAGQHRIEERMWPSRWLYRLGLDLAFFVLPFHGVRAIRGRVGPPPFPGSDPRLTNEGFRQAMGDFRDLVMRLKRDRQEVSVMGMSLGGYTAALAATVEPSLCCAVPVIPLGSLADFARDQGRLGKTRAQATLEHSSLAEAHRVVSPLHRKPLIAGERVLVIGAEADRITPLHHAEGLAGHFGAPLATWPGGHLLQIGRRAAFLRVGQFFAQLGLTPAPASA